MFESLIEHETDGIIKGLTLEWKCPKCEGMNFKILLKTQRESGQYHSRCRYCKAKFLVNYPSSETVIEGEAEFMERLTEAEFFEDEEMDLIRDFAEIEYLTTGTYNKAAESGIRWNDPAIGVEWPVTDPVLSAKDESAQTLAEWLARPEAANFTY